jgi:hypothetical protein
MGNGATGYDKADRSTPLLFESSLMPASDVSSSDVMSWPTRMPLVAAEDFAISADVAHQPCWMPEETQARANIADSFAQPMGAAPQLDGAPAIGFNAESLRQMLDELPPAFTYLSR